MTIAIARHNFRNAGNLARTPTQDVANPLRAGINVRGEPLLALWGGSTSRRFRRHVPRHSFDWSRTGVTLTQLRRLRNHDSSSKEHTLHEMRRHGTPATTVSAVTLPPYWCP